MSTSATNSVTMSSATPVTNTQPVTTPRYSVAFGFFSSKIIPLIVVSNSPNSTNEEIHEKIKETFEKIINEDDKKDKN